MDVNKVFELPPYDWDDQVVTKCSYKNSKGEDVDVNVLGFYNSLSENAVNVEVFGDYQNAILYFNVVRSSWAPFSDLLRIAFETDDVTTGEYFIEYIRREEVDP